MARGHRLRLGIGTAQFGMDYGVANRGGRLTPEAVRAIVIHGHGQGVSVIDTAPGYGVSESVLGAALPDAHRFRIVTKTPAFPNRPLGVADAEVLRGALGESLTRLRQRSVEGLLVHNADDLLAPGGEALYSALQELKSAGKVGKVGASVYSAAQIDALVHRYPLDLVQLPLSVLDTRLVASGHLRALKRQGVEIHARSIFLQGLLLMDPARLGVYFEPLRPQLERYHSFLRERELSAVEGAIGFVKGVAEVDCVIVGVDGLDQLQANLAAFQRGFDDELRDGLRGFGLDDPRFLNPAHWKLGER